MNDRYLCTTDIVPSEVDENDPERTSLPALANPPLSSSGLSRGPIAQQFRRVEMGHQQTLAVPK
jgi:uncharacterized hydantoinase/oxoprolinase family protein